MMDGMKLQRICMLFFLFTSSVYVSGQELKNGTIDRKVLVQRHNFHVNNLDEQGPSQVGNGDFAYGFDITGMQTLHSRFSTMSNWSWHSERLPVGMSATDFKKTMINTNGRMVSYDLPNSDQALLTQWLQRNPHRFNLGRIGLWYKDENGEPLQQKHLFRADQYVDLWTSVVVSRFEIDGNPVIVTTVGDPNEDIIAFRIESSLVKEKRLGVFIEFPYASLEVFSNGSNYNKPDLHSTKMVSNKKGQVVFDRGLDSTKYQVVVNWTGNVEMKREKQHRYYITGSDNNSLDYVVQFAPVRALPILPSYLAVKKRSERYWPTFWRSGGVMDFSGSKDPRWKELERRVVLSQYLTKLNTSGQYPAQETGLVNNSWYGRFHYEMILWHGAHFALWNRWSLLNKSLEVYQTNLAGAKERAKLQGYAGARYPKCTGPDGHEWPHPIHAFLIWQQPHPIFFANLDYRAHPTKATLNKWSDIISASADFLASYAVYDSVKKQYELAPPIVFVPENNDYYKDSSGAFELAYWRYGLKTAQQLIYNTNGKHDPFWEKIISSLEPIPVQDSLYVQWKNVSGMWNKFNYEHPALLGIYGLLPGDGIDSVIMKKTFHKVLAEWRFDTGWGWDFPMAAMSAARLGEPAAAIDMLLHGSPKNGFDIHGFVGGGNPYPYLPTNGSLLYAIALMVAGWDNDGRVPEPGFPKDGSWVIKWEGLKRAP